jgi:acetate kinase
MGLQPLRNPKRLPMNILVLNSGSSTLKFQLISTDPEKIQSNSDDRICRGLLEGIGGETKITIHVRNEPATKLTAQLPDLPAALNHLVRWLTNQSTIPEIKSPADVHAVGHRVVHGGETFTSSAVITDEVLKGIEACSDLAPLHNPLNVQGIRAAQKIFGPQTPQVAVFDTSFHHTLPEYAYLYAIPYHLYELHHIRRYGFHGTSHRYVSYRYRALNNLTREQTNIITLHLGNGCSAAAIRNGNPVDTSMGLTPLEGLVMGTRSGDLDPAIVDFIAAKEKLSPEEMDLLLNTKSGLLGLSGQTNDMRLLQQKAKENDRRARLAIEVFCYRAKKYIGAYLAAIGGADAVVFTGGIGENSVEVRAQICDGLAFFGLKVDHAKNSQASGRESRITSDDSRLHAFVIPTDEELLIARDTLRCILNLPHPS